MENLPFILAISGPTSAGKTYFSERLLERTREENIGCSRISTDSFYRDLAHLSYEERTKINYDDPNSIAGDEFISAISDLRDQRETKIPVYDFSTHTRTGEYEHVKPHDLILVEGIFSLSFDEVLDDYSMMIYVDLDPDLRLIRRVRRDTTERGRSLDSILRQYINTVRPTQERYVRNDKNKADIILSGNRDHGRVIELLISYVKYKKSRNH